MWCNRSSEGKYGNRSGAAIPGRLIGLIAVVFVVGCASADPAERATQKGPTSVEPASERADSGDKEGIPTDSLGPTPDRAGICSKSKPVKNSDDTDSDVHSLGKKQFEAFVARGPSFPMRAASVRPVHRDGAFIGYRIAELSPGASETVGDALRPGDVIKAINGVQVDRPDDYMEAWKKLRKMCRIRVDLRRDGTRKTVVWRVNTDR